MYNDNNGEGADSVSDHDDLGDQNFDNYLNAEVCYQRANIRRLQRSSDARSTSMGTGWASPIRTQSWIQEFMKLSYLMELRNSLPPTSSHITCTPSAMRMGINTFSWKA